MDKLCYLAGDIMSRGSALQREEEYNKFIDSNIAAEVYSPIMNKSINDKTSVTVEENNKLAEAIVKADTERLWNSDIVVMEPIQHAIGTMCELGILFGWKYLCEQLKDKTEEEIKQELERISNKEIYCHYYDLRTNHLPEIDFRRSFGINQFLYGLVLYTAQHNDFMNFEDIMKELQEKYPQNIDKEKEVTNG